MSFKLFIFIFIYALTNNIHARDLNEVALFSRCYMHLTQTFPRKDLPLMLEVKAGSKTAIAACKEVIDSVSFSANGNTVIPNLNDTTALSVLKVFHNLHYSWFATKYFPEIQDYFVRNIANVFDASSPALYFTKAMFDPGSNYENIFKGDITLRSLRENDERTTTVLQPHSSANDILQGIKFSGTGSLIGISAMTKDDTYQVMVYTANPSDDPAAVRVASPPIVINTHWGGGVLGSPVYMLQNIQGAAISHKSDGGVNANRKWSRSVFQDFFCRELPVVRESDSAGYVLPASTLTYRNSKGCVKCHASADTMAGLVRNAKYDRRGSFFDPGGSYAFITKYATTKTVSPYFPAEKDDNYHQRPTDGSFFYRTYNGELIFKELSDLEQLGTEFLSHDDVYICTAKRYFEYFTGISADISDVKDPSNKNFPSLSAHQQKYRDVVVGLGKSLREHKSPKALVKSIMDHPIYRSHDFKLSE